MHPLSNWGLVGTFMTTGDINDIIAIMVAWIARVKVAQTSFNT